jgi:hypothetical protein
MAVTHSLAVKLIGAESLAPNRNAKIRFKHQGVTDLNIIESEIQTLLPGTLKLLPSFWAIKA